jgi:hypothetical protein
MFEIAVVQLFQAGSALSRVRGLETAMQTLMSDCPVTITIARLLVDDIGYPGGQLVGMYLVTVLKIIAPEAVFGQDRGKLLAFRRGTGVKSWNGTRCIITLAEHQDAAYKEKHEA